MTDPWQLSVRELGLGYRAGRLTPIEAVQACIARIEAVNPALNAVVATRYAEARAEAVVATRHLREGHDSPLMGVPCTVKEFVAVAGMPHTAGMPSRRHTVADTDATVVRRLKEAGAIVLGVTNAPEGGLWHETNNPVYGRTHNPHDLRRTPGGSSGGEGAIIAAGGVPFGIGSDTGGSIRIPAGFCGIAGHKPTGGRVPATGHFPDAPGTEADVPMSLGPLARSVADLALVLAAIEGPDGIDPQCRAMPPLAEGGSWAEMGVTVVAMPSNGRFRPDAAVATAVTRAAFALAAAGATAVTWQGPSLVHAFSAWANLMAAQGTYADVVRPDEPMGALVTDLLGWPFGRSRHSGGVLAILLLEVLFGVRPDADGVTRARELRMAFDEALGPQGLMLHPVYPRTAPRHRAIAARSPRDIGCTTLFNVTESPVTVVRVGTDQRGMPIGVQVVAARGNDALALRAAAVLEAVFGATLPVDPR